MPLSLRKVSGIVCTVVAGLFASQAEANVDQVVCTCNMVCDTRVTNNWYPFDANGNFAPNDPNPNRCKKRVGRLRCEQVCWTVGGHAMLPEERNEFLDEVFAEGDADLTTNLFFDEVFAQEEDLSSECGTALVQCDNTPPECTSKIDWEARPIIIEVDGCTDNLSGCDPATYEPREFDRFDQPRGADACDIAGNCRECDPILEDNEPPTCVATFEHEDRWHRGEDFETNPPLRCWLESCDDAAAAGEQASGCLHFPVLNDSVDVFNDPDGENEVVETLDEQLQPVHGDTCTMQVCDNAGWCNTCESVPLQYDDSDVCQNGGEGLGKTADGVLCGECDPDDDDCLCIKGDASKCRDDGPVNCYTNPFHDRCPGFQNPACLADPFTPGCPVVNPCYPVQAYDGVICPRDAARFCARNPYHYGCNLACDIDTINCDPVPPGDDPNPGNPGGGGQQGQVINAPLCPGEPIPQCAAGSTFHCELDPLEDCQSCTCSQDPVACTQQAIVCNDGQDMLCPDPGCASGCRCIE